MFGWHLEYDAVYSARVGQHGRQPRAAPITLLGLRGGRPVERSVGCAWGVWRGSVSTGSSQAGGELDTFSCRRYRFLHCRVPLRCWTRPALLGCQF